MVKIICKRRLKDVVTTGQKLYLIFEFVDQDLKQFLEQFETKQAVDPKLIKVGVLLIG